MINRFKTVSPLVATLVASGIILSACGGSSGGSTNSNQNPSGPVSNSAITIDNTGTVPVFGGSSTKSVVYVHNNTSQTISGISFSAADNVNTSNGVSNQSTVKTLASKIQALFSSSSVVSPSGFSIDASQCSSIPAGQSCPIGFTTPVLDAKTAQASALITAKFTVNKQNLSSNNVLNFARVDNSTNNGAVIQSGVSLSGFGNPEAYGTVYIYGSGANQVYNITKLASSNPGIKITQGNINGQQIQSNFVQAVEVGAPTGSSKASTLNKTTLADTGSGDTGINATLTVQSAGLQSGQTFTSNVSLSVNPVSNGAILTAGVVPLINSAVAAPSGSLYLVNGGNESAVLGSITYPSGISAATGSGACSSNLAPGAGCSIYFTISNQSGGSGSITVPYTYADGSGSLAQNVTWYNGIGAPLLYLAAQNNPLSFNQTVGANNTIMVTNVGGYNLTSVAAATPTVTSGSATASLTTPALSCQDASSNATGTTLPVGGTCTYTVNVTDTARETGDVNIGVSGSYNNGTVQTYSRNALFGYSSIAYAANLSLAPNPATIVTVGDNFESSTQVVTLSNIGAAPAAINSIGLASNPAFLTESNNCGSTLASSASCNVTLILGPTSSNVVESGISGLSVNYSGGGTTGGTTTSIVNWTVQPNSQNLTMGTISATGSASGAGTSASPYSFNGAVTSGQSVTMTYTNGGTNAVKISGVTNTNSPIAWNINTAASTCYNGGSLPSGAIAPGASCTIVYKNVLGTNANALPSIGSSYTENLTAPSLVFVDQNTQAQFQIQPTAPAGGTTIYATGTQATVANSVTVAGSNLTVSNVLANATGYSAVNVTSQMESYFTAITPGSGCTASASGLTNAVTQSCTLTPVSGTATGSTVYAMDTTNYLNKVLTTLFSINTNSQTVSMSPLFATQVIAPVATSKVIFITAGTYDGNLQAGGGASGIPGIPAASGIAGADAICQYEATQSGSVAPAGTYKALIIANNRYPCNGSGVCGSAGWLNWTVAANTQYSTPGSAAVILTSDANGIFEDTYTQGLIKTPSGAGNNSNFWSGINGIKTGTTTGASASIVGWSYANNSASWTGGNWSSFADNTCSSWTSSSRLLAAFFGDNGVFPDDMYLTTGLAIEAGYDSSTAYINVDGYVSRWINGSDSGCGTQNMLMCVQQ